MSELIYLKAKGSYGVYYGLGLNEIAVNFENITGLISLAGKNGLGKTTVMEMLSPFDSFPSTKLKDPAGYNIKKQFMARDSYKEVCYRFNGNLYVFRVEIPAGTTMSPEGYIWCDGVPLVKGKIREYRQKVSELFGSERLFYSSIFSCQGGEKLTDLTVGDFKQLLIELLGLNRYVEWWHTVGKVLKECESVLALVMNDQKNYESKKDEAQKNLLLLNDQKSNLELQKVEERTLLDLVTKTQEEIGILTKAVAEVEKKEVVIAEKEKQLKAMTDEIVSARATMSGVEAEYQEWLSEHNTENRAHEALIAIKDQILSASKALEQVKKEEAAWKEELITLTAQGTEKKEQIAEIDLIISAIKAALAEIENDKVLKDLNTLLSEKENKLGVIKIGIENIETAILNLEKDPATKALEKELEVFKSAEDLLRRRPEKCKIDDCDFIKNAMDAIALKPGKLEQIEASRRENKKQIQKQVDNKLVKEVCRDSLTKEIQGAVATIETRKKELALKTKESMLSYTAESAKKNQLQAEKDELTKRYHSVTSFLSEVPGRIEKLETLAGQKADVEVAEKMLVQANKIKTEKEKSIQVTRQEFAKKYYFMEVNAESLSKEIIALTPAKASHALSKDVAHNKTSLTVYETGLTKAKTKTADIEKAIAVLEDKSKLSDKDAAELKRLEASELFIRKEITQWEYIRAGVSKSGLQALEIASAAPLLTSLANDLLHSAFGGEFFLDLITQHPETGAEILEIMITREDGETFPLSRYSGGESTWVLQAFKAAQILVNAEKSGVHFKTCFADEETGALDKDKAERFIKMYRALMEKGGFEKFFFISHIQDCQALADYVLTFEKGGIKSEADIMLVDKELVA